MVLWEELSETSERHRLPDSQEPHAGLVSTMHGWASGWSLARTLDHSMIGAGDFVRWAKQTIDLLDQIAQACEHAHVDTERLTRLGSLARDAKRRVRRGIVEASSSA